ncbi:MAG: hypothetical protein RML94_12335 [Bacteroidia bacterium]|nr:hypothetical protein [Bacteroidia bacterium]
MPTRSACYGLRYRFGATHGLTPPSACLTQAATRLSPLIQNLIS